MVAEAAAAISFDDDAPIVLAGDPRRLRGTMVLRNPGDAAVVLRRPRLTEVRDRSGTRGRTPLAGGGRLPSVRLAAGSVTTVPLRLRVDATTPPGEYREEIEIAGLRREVVLQVSERIDLRIRPSQLVVPNVPGGTRRTTVAFDNRGNVPVRVPEFLVAVLDDERFDCRVLRRALAEIDAETATFEGYFDQLIRSGKATMSEIGHVGIRIESGPIDVPAGATVPVTMELHVPERVDRHSRYQGIVPVATTDLTVIVAPIGLPQPDPPAAEEAPGNQAAPTRTPASKATGKRTTASNTTSPNKASQKKPPSGSPSRQNTRGRRTGGKTQAGPSDEEPS